MKPDMIIRPANEGDHVNVAATLAAAFARGDVAEWALPPGHPNRAMGYRAYGELLFSRGRHLGIIDVMSDFRGAAVWYVNPVAPVDENVSLAATYAMLGTETAQRLAALDMAVRVRTPKEPHHELAYIGVRPDDQRQGIASALLAHHLRHLDVLRTPAWLVATSLAARKMFTEHGFVVTERFRVPDDGPLLWSMWRHPSREPGPVPLPLDEAIGRSLGPLAGLPAFPSVGES